MLQYRDVFVPGLLFATFILIVPAASAADAPAYITAAVGDTGRPPLHKTLDADRKPAEIVAFSQIKPGQKVVDFVPGDGYYTRILSKVVGPRGKVYSFVPLNDVLDMAKLRNAEQAMMKQGKVPPLNPADTMLMIQNIEEYKNMTVLWEPLSQYGGQFALPEQVDAVFTADNYHTLHNTYFSTVQGQGLQSGPGGGLIYSKVSFTMASVSKAIFRALKPGGTYMVMDYASAPGAGFTGAETLQRSDPEAVKAEILAAGFVLDGESKILANPADDHTKPHSDASLRDKTDQFMLRFRKPANAKTPDKRPPADFMKNYYGNTYIYQVGSPGERHHFYHPDGTYQELGKADANRKYGDEPTMQSGTDYWDVDGHNCQLHMYPVSQRGFIVCHGFLAHDVGEKTTQDNGMGQGPLPATIVKGISYTFP